MVTFTAEQCPEGIRKLTSTVKKKIIKKQIFCFCCLIWKGNIINLCCTQIDKDISEVRCSLKMKLKFMNHIHGFDPCQENSISYHLSIGRYSFIPIIILATCLGYNPRAQL